ncbi:MAG TPA: hypothetical protein VKR21_16845 [Solirubrobacteraceae bacterium]|nr:hypothetical protein [Solirubrobacteraceae bacterium]
MKHFFRAFGLAVAVCAVLAASAQAGQIRGIVLAHGQHQASTIGAAVSNLTYHGGPVMHTNKVFAIYWIPSGFSVQSGYQNTINTFFQNVAADSGKSSNVYFSDTQYYDTTNGNILYSSSWGTSVLDTQPYPANGCHDVYTSVCLTDAQIQNEIRRLGGVYKGAATGLGTEYFMFTPKNVGSCEFSFGLCAYSYYCAYHSNFKLANGSQVLYANMPYAAWSPANCGSGQSPNGNDADSTINVTSHEHNETITDPLGTGWLDATNQEDGDKCAWMFGSPLGGTPGAEYNQVINGHHYWLQQEWSNASSGCVLTGT